MYKSKLQEFCHQKKWGLPIYTCVRDGQDHCPMFKASVVVKDSTFDTPTICKSSKEAFNQAAKVAFLHFTSEPSYRGSETVENKKVEKEIQSPKVEAYAGEDEEAEEAAAAIDALYSLPTNTYNAQNDPTSYKDLLRKLVKSEGYFPPKYTITESDDPHCKTFSCIVEVEGSVFKGAAANSKKQAELNAAKAAYTYLMERKLFEPFHFSSVRYDILALAPRLDSPASISNKNDNPTITGANFIGKCEKTDHSSDARSTISKPITQEPTVKPAIIPDTKKPNGSKNSVCANVAGISLPNKANYSMKQTNDVKSYLLCNRFRVFGQIPDIVLPKGTIILPIREDRWAMVSLEFPNENAI